MTRSSTAIGVVTLTWAEKGAVKHGINCPRSRYQGEHSYTSRGKDRRIEEQAWAVALRRYLFDV
jgi:hypothetical protein